MARVALVRLFTVYNRYVPTCDIELHRLLGLTKALGCRLSENFARSLMELFCLQVLGTPTNHTIGPYQNNWGGGEAFVFCTMR